MQRTQKLTAIERQLGEPYAEAKQSKKDSSLGVLIVDDHPLIRKSLEMGFKARNFAVWTAADGGEAVVVYEREASRIDIALVDLRMPVLDGRQTLVALRERNPLLRLCFMTCDCRMSTAAELLRNGALRVFPKPFESVSKLIEEVRHLALSPPVEFHPSQDSWEEDSFRIPLSAIAAEPPRGLWRRVNSIVTRLCGA